MFVNLSWHVWIIFCLNFKTFFWRYILSLYFPFQILLNVFPKEPSIWYHTRSILNKYAPLFQACCSVFARNLLKGLLNHAGEMSGCYFWHVQQLWNYCLWLAVLTVLRSGKDERYGFEVSWKHWRLEFVFSLLGRFIWFCKTAKLSKSVLSNFKRIT